MIATIANPTTDSAHDPMRLLPFVLRLAVLTAIIVASLSNDIVGVAYSARSSGADYVYPVC